MKQSTTNLFMKYMKYWYGIEGNLDEYRQKELNRIGNNAFFFTYIPLDFVFLLFIVLWNLHQQQWAYIAFIFGFLLITMTVSGYINQQIKKLKLNVLEVEKAEYPAAKKRIIRRCFWQSIIIGIMFVAIESVIAQFQLLSLSALVFIVVTIIVFFAASLIHNLNKIKIISDEN